MKKQIFNKHIYRRCFMIHAISFFYYVLSIPHIIISVIVWKIKKYSIKVLVLRLREINAIRRTVHYYCKKQNMYESEKVRFSYWYNQIYIGVHIRFFRKMSERDYELFKEACGLATGLEVTELKKHRGYYAFELYKEFKPLQELYCDRSKIAIGTSIKGLFYWDFSKYPHGLIVGPTGQGKTNMLSLLIHTLNTKKYDVWVIDGKNVDLHLYKTMLHEYVQFHGKEYDEVMQCVDEFIELMQLRLKELEEKRVKKYSLLDDMKPVFLIVEEYTAIMENATKAFKEEIQSKLSYLGRLSRATGLNLVFCMQRPDTVYIKGELRSNLSLRVVCGAGDDACYKMAFDENDFKPLEVGQIWARQNLEPQVLSVIDMDKFEKENILIKEENKNAPQVEN